MAKKPHDMPQDLWRETTNGHHPEAALFKPKSAKELLAKKFGPIRWAVPGVVPEGVTIVAGKPKIGKSWLGLSACVAVAAGGYALGKIEVQKGAALYLGLGDDERRLQRRLKKVLAGNDCPEGLEYATEWPRIDEGGLVALDAWLDEHPNARVVVIATLKKFRPKDAGNRSVYDVDYEALEPLLPLAAKHQVAILIVHHLRKMEAGDPLDTISGSTGLTGGVDGVMILKRDRGKQYATLVVDGRDLEESSELALRCDADIASWSLMGDAEEFRMSRERAAILDALRELGEAPTRRISKYVEQEYENTRKLLSKMASEGVVRVKRRGNTNYYSTDPSDPKDPKGSAEAGIETIGIGSSGASPNGSGGGSPVNTGTSGPIGTSGTIGIGGGSGITTPKQEADIAKLIAGGMDPDLARAEVLGELDDEKGYV